jgi:arsenite/tail-anchored protein-transporting ATPase
VTRILLFTGKGGVGKTTVAAATALRCAREGLRTLVLSTDPAHSLADALAKPLDSQPMAVAGHLWGQQLDATERFEDVWGEIQTYLMQVMDWAGVDGIEAEELSIVPGLDEIFNLTDIKTLATSGAWDVLVVDCAPTAETIRLLSLPDVLSWYMDRLFAPSRRVTRLVRPLVAAVTSMPVASDHVFAATKRLYGRLVGVRELLTDPHHASVRLVVNPEQMVIAEARRTATYLSLFGYRVDAVIANRILPEEVTDPWFSAWKSAQAEHLVSIVEGFAPVPVLRAQLAPKELVGVAALRGFGDDLYGDLDAAGVLFRNEPLRVEAQGDDYVLWLALPFADRDELEVGRHHDELHVRVGPYRRSMVLPDSLVRRHVTTASLSATGLALTFSTEPEEWAPDEGAPDEMVARSGTAIGAGPSPVVGGALRG